MRFKILILAALAIFCCCFQAAADPVILPALGANAVSMNNGNPSDFEAGAAGSISVSPHISAVGSGWYGFGRNYVRGTLGARVTATDVDDPNFSIGIGGQFNVSSDPAVRPEGWDADATVGWRPYPAKWPQAVLVTQGGYFPQSGDAYILFGVRYSLRPF